MNNILSERTNWFKQMREFVTPMLIVWMLILILLFVLGTQVFLQRFPIRDYWLNVFTESLSIIATIGVLNELSARREARQRHRQTIENVSSPVQAVAVAAATTLQRNGYLDGRDSVLRDKDLSYADLHNVRLPKCNLDGAIMQNIKLDHSDLPETSLQGVDLSAASVTQSNLSGVDLQFAMLVNTDLSLTDLTLVDLSNAQMPEATLIGCNLSSANLEGTNLKDVQLAGAIIEGVKCNHKTILPDGEYWHEHVNWETFTSADNHNFIDAI